MTTSRKVLWMYLPESGGLQVGLVMLLLNYQVRMKQIQKKVTHLG